MNHGWDPRYIQQQGHERNYSDSHERHPYQHAWPDQRGYNQNQYQNTYGSRPAPPPGMLNSSYNALPQRHDPYSRQQNSGGFQPQNQQEEWKKYVDSLKVWREHYKEEGTEPTEEHANLFDQYLPGWREDAVKEKAKVGWPATFQDYIGRELEAAKGTKYRTAMQKEIEALISQVKGRLWDIDWTKEPSRLAEVKYKVDNEDRGKNDTSGSNKRRMRGWESSEVVNSGRSKAYRASEPGGDQARGGWGKIPTKGWDAKSSPINVTTDGSKSGWASFGKSGRTEMAKDRTSKWSNRIPENSKHHNDFASKQAKAARAARFAAAERLEKQKSPTARHDPYAAGRQEQIVKSAMHRAQSDGYELDLSEFRVKGTSQSLEKKYLRLTGVPDPSTVRPQPVLEKSLDMIADRWESRESSVDQQITYNWVCNQLKAVRQDLTIQHIQNDFTVKVYETHARIALHQKDVGEFNQCLTQLLQLYRQDCLCKDNQAEFAGYHVLYLLFVRHKYGEQNGELVSLLASMPAPLRSSKSVRHALAIRSALDRGMYRNFWRLYNTTPNLGKQILSLMVNYVRHETLKIALATYRPTVALEALFTDFLHLSHDSQDDEKLWKEWILDNSAVVKQDKNLMAINAKESMQAFTGNFQWPVLGGDSVQQLRLES